MIEVISGMLVFGSILFWAIVALEVGLLFYFSEKSGLVTTLSIALFAAAMQFGFKIEWAQWVANNWFASLIAVISYFVIGAGWSVFKWWLYVNDKFDAYTDFKIAWLKEKGLPIAGPVPEELRPEWVDYIDDKNRSRFRWDDEESKITSEPPSARMNKDRIVCWMSFWPASMLWSVLNDMIVRIFNEIYRWISVTLQQISDRAFSDVKAELPTKEQMDAFRKKQEEERRKQR